ncbi:MAG: hypothetical protein PHQ14_13640 [Chromatiales bacterium]|jgi:chromosome segregation ATPase|nr:hypothetical protein [Chromatiales bacterium]MDX9767272.1 hypothetical protein [Ectothiorhodospiraceae bacterium]
MISGTQGASSAVFEQVQKQQALREAEQAEQRAQRLQAESNKARAEADQAENKARGLEVESSQAQSQADSVRRGVAAGDALSQVDTQISELRGQIAEIGTPAPAETPSAGPTVNVEGQTIGTTISVTA